MYYLWWVADRDLLQDSPSYTLQNTGQGLQRVQACPQVARSMRAILK